MIPRTSCTGLCFVRRPAKHVRSGFSLIEVLIAAVILAVAITGISGSILSAMTLNRVNRETAIAQQAARRVLEEISGVPFDSAFACYNRSAMDDGALPVAAQGANFAVVGLDPQVGDADGMCGQVIFPATQAGLNDNLMENVVDATLGTPRDLNGDGGVDNIDHSGDYTLLPVRVVVAWRGVRGDRQVELATMLCTR